MESSQKANLGCGTLILIALIVIIFSGAGDNGTRNALQQLRTEIRSLQSEIQAQRASIQRLEKIIQDSRQPQTTGTPEP